MTSRAAATRYARALFDVALTERQDLDQIDRELTGTSTLVQGNEQLQRALVNPAIPASRKRAVVERLLSLSPVNPILSRVLLLLADRDRLVLLPDLAEAYRSRLMDHQQIVRARVTTAVVLPADRVSALQQGLADATGRRVDLQVDVDPSILGGAVARIGSTVYDGSITTQLEKLKQRLVESEVAGAEAPRRPTV
jgi:F-type H+-transporting ATPase subunit delta